MATIGMNRVSEMEFDERRAAGQRAIDDVAEMVEGKRPLPPLGSPQWGSEPFQRAICHVIGQARKWGEDARKLAIVKEVFGGARG